ncbi:MAG TPA: TonB-dependent receptor plug domain-containing protein [Mucilaginibacter sp.]|jgi:TonB-dependent SusC/RagA subfamily outer membrane receptor|nr:TonB-dependent receptor plug domain-containing protein [Mucilaginibacter sp.]
MKRIFYATAILVMSLQSIAFCQTDSAIIKNAVSKLRTLLVDHVTEKAYLHFDRPYAYYVAGDVVYFKAYVTMGERHEPTNISGILHVDLINKNDVLMQSIALKLSGGIGWGDFALPDTLQKGNYRIRAYTEWMRNTEHPYFFDQYISVSAINDVDRAAQFSKQGTKPSLQFFPEGGNLVTDIRSKVAFKAMGPDGLGTDIKGIVLDNENKEVARITSAHLGMGVFDFIPEADRTYKARVTFADGSQSVVDLPPAQIKGIVLSVNTGDPAKVSIEINANRAYYKENLNKNLNILVYWAGTVRTVTTKLDNAVLGLDLPARNFRTGILQVTLLSQTGEPLSERMVFIQNPDLLNLSLSTNKAAYGKRENVQLNLNAKSPDGNGVNGSFSVSVVDESKILVDEDTENSILSYLLLTSDIKGYVEKPNYYFTNITKETRANLDVLMLTQGYRRFVWKQLLNDNPSTTAAYKPEQYMDISGTLTTKGGQPIVDAKVVLLPLGQTETTDAQGRFRFAKIDFQTGTSFILKAPSSVGRNAVLTLNKPAAGPLISAGNIVDAKYNANADILASLQNNQRQGVFVASNEPLMLKDDKSIASKQTANYRSSNIGGPGHADQVISGDQIKNASTLSTGLNGLLRGVLFNSGVPALNTGFTVSNGSQTLNPMLIVVNGSQIGQGVNIDQYNPVDVETVEILKGATASIYGVAGGQGVMVITTREGRERQQLTSKEMSPGIFSITPLGLYKAREFYSPAYDAAQTAGKLRDTRTTIFWKPEVITDSSGNASLNFFNADGVGTYRVEVQGIDSKGNLGRQVFRYRVQ